MCICTVAATSEINIFTTVFTVMTICARITGGKSIGFLEDMARLNVGLTRAKLALILIGNLDTLAVSR
jgi:hypothetical protein